MIPWQSRRHLEDHFRLHGAEVGAATIEAYDASAQAMLLRADVIFGYDDPRMGLRRTGNYESATSLFVAVNEHDAIVTHFRADDEYIRDLLGDD